MDRPVDGAHAAPGAPASVTPSPSVGPVPASRPPVPGVPPPATCRNCGAHATGHFCGNCGQETRLALPTFGAFMREAAGRYFAMDGRFWRTMAALVGRPGYLTKEYLRGRRKRYIRPARLFLVLYLVLFAAIGLLQSPGTLSDEIVFVDRAAHEKARDDAATAERSKGQSDPRDDSIAILNVDDGATFFGFDRDLNLTLRLANADVPLPPEVRKRWDHFKLLPREEKGERIYAGMLRYGPYAMVALLPAFALLLKLAYLGRGRTYPDRPKRYAEHLVYSAHLHAFAAVMLLAMLLLPFAPTKFLLALWIVYYVMRARQNVYGGRWWAGALRAVVVGLVYLVLLGVAIAGLVFAAVMLR